MYQTTFITMLFFSNTSQIFIKYENITRFIAITWYPLAIFRAGTLHDVQCQCAWEPLKCAAQYSCPSGMLWRPSLLLLRSNEGPWGLAFNLYLYLYRLHQYTQDSCIPPFLVVWYMCYGKTCLTSEVYSWRLQWRWLLEMVPFSCCTSYGKISTCAHLY